MFRAAAYSLGCHGGAMIKALQNIAVFNREQNRDRDIDLSRSVSGNEFHSVGPDTSLPVVLIEMYQSAYVTYGRVVYSFVN